MRFACLTVICILLLASYSLAKNQPTNPFQESEEQFLCLVRGTGVIEPPYEEVVQFLLVYQPELDCLHFVFDHPLDPDQESELADYQAKHDLTWSVCYFELEGHTWSVITAPSTGEPQKLAGVFLSQLCHLSFISTISPFGTEEQASR
jgi:hypothetical protein